MRDFIPRKLSDEEKERFGKGIARAVAAAEKNGTLEAKASKPERLRGLMRRLVKFLKGARGRG